MSASKLTTKPAASSERIERIVLLLRGQKVILDFHLAELYNVSTKALNQAVKRNIGRFPEDFMFQLSKEETALILRSQIGTASVNSSHIVTSSDATTPKSAVPHLSNWSQFVTSSKKHRGLAYRPFAFTEQGVSMLSGVLRSARAVQVNIEIMRTFVRLRQWLASNVELARKLATLEKKYDRQFKIVFDAIRELMDESTPLKPVHGREIGFHAVAACSDKQRKRKSKKNLS